VASALDQDYATLEVVIVGDCCPELDPAAFSGEPRVRVFNLPQNHGGGAIPRNHGICMAAGKLIAYLDDDNAWEPDHVSSLVRLLEQAGAAFAFSSMQVDGKDLGFAEPKYQGIDTSCIVHDRDLIARYGGWRDCEPGGYGHDWELVKRWLDGGERWAASKKPTLRYNAESSGQAGFLRELRG
jgi:glycosyltransferase involved in cell wall biosynthesis